MIAPNQIVEVSINSKNKKYYENILNKQLKIKDIVSVSPEDLMHGSAVKFYAICDNCGVQKEVVGQSYFRAVDHSGEYFCDDCHRIRDSKQMRRVMDSMTEDELKLVTEKRKVTCRKKYGVDNPVQVYLNQTGEDSKVNLEALFNTAYQHKELIKEILNK